MRGVEERTFDLPLPLLTRYEQRGTRLRHREELFALLVEELLIRLPEDPAEIEGPIRVGEEELLAVSSLGQSPTNRQAIEATGCCQGSRCDFPDLSVVYIWIEVEPHSRIQTLSVNVDDEGIPSRRHTRR